MDYFLSLFQKSTNQGYRSSAISTLVWFILALLGGLTSAQVAGAPSWIVGLIAIVFAMAALSLIGLSWYLAIKKPEMLRSEKYALAVQAMQKRGLRGDDLIGFVKALGPDEGPERIGPPLQAPPIASDLSGPGTILSADPGATGATSDLEGR